MSARDASYEVVMRVFEDGAYADRAFRSAAASLSARDRAFAMELAYGTVRQRRLLDHGIEQIGSRALDEIDPPVRAALRLGAYQLAFMASVPDHAAVSETVELVRRAGLERAVAFANAVMRRLSEQLTQLVGALDDGSAASAALRHSYPDWIAESWWSDLGSDSARRLMAAQNRPAELAVRVNHRHRPLPDGVAAVNGKSDSLFPRALIVERVAEGWLEHGLAWPQSRASQLAGSCVGSVPSDRVLDLCAAPGGKATQLLGDVVAVEVDAGRARELAEMVQRQGAENVRVVNADGRALPSELTGFDRALVDAPCSGLGVLASRPDLRWRARQLPELQVELVRAALERVRVGGTVTYSVCTTTAAETEGVIDAVAAPLESLGDVYPQFRHPRRPNCLLTLPHEHGTAGFFIARLRREG
ncbi:MAG: transcription antitermination factor NusB [Gaiellaceae bacterium]